MTQIFEIISETEAGQFSRPVDINQKQTIKTKMKKFFETKNLTFYEQNESFFVQLRASNFCHPKIICNGILGLLQIIVEHNNIYFHLCLLDSQSIEIKALSTYQKTGLSRLCNALSAQLDSLIVCCHPVTGSIKISINFQTRQLDEISLILEQALKTIQEHRTIIDRILQFLELVPYQMSDFLQFVSVKMEKCRYLLLGPHEHSIASTEKDFHHEYFIEPLSQFQLVHCWLWQSQNKLFLESVIQKLKSSLIYLPLGIRKTNYLHLKLGQSPQQMVKALENVVNTPRKKSQKANPVVISCQLSSLQNIQLQFALKTESSCKTQMDKVEKISKRYYCSFLREYVVLNNVNYANLYFTACKYEKLTPLSKFLARNRPYLSFLTRLYLCTELIGIAYIGMTQLRKFKPIYNMENLMITSEFKIKFKSIMHEAIAPTSIEIAQMCYTILYDIRCSSIKMLEQDRQIKMHKKTHEIKIIDDGQSKFEGISIINFWLKKILLDVIDNKNRRVGHQPRNNNVDDENISSLNTDQCQQMDYLGQFLPSTHKQIVCLEQMLFVVSLAYRTYCQVYDEKSDNDNTISM